MKIYDHNNNNCHGGDVNLSDDMTSHFPSEWIKSNKTVSKFRNSMLNSFRFFQSNIMKSHEATWELAMRDYIDISTKFAASKFKLLWVTGSVASKLQRKYEYFLKALNDQLCKKVIVKRQPILFNSFYKSFYQ